jgi:hypothetical protein
MMTNHKCRRFVSSLVSVLCALSAPAGADVVTEWNAKAAEIVATAKIATPVANRTMAIVQTAVYEAVKAATDGSREAAVAAANRTVLSALTPSQKDAIESAYEKAIASIQDGAAKDAGIAAGEKAAAEVTARRTDDGTMAAESYRPATAAGVYVPTTMPAVPHWPQRKPWMLESPSQFRPGPPPALDSERWARDYNEVKALGAKNGSTRTAEQTEIARFWEATLPSIYYGVVRSVADQPGRDVARNARLFAAVTQAMDDAIIAVFDAKYQYGFWRPITAIRNGDRDRSDATERDAGWSPFIETPMHPEYPCAHCILAATVGTIVQAEIGDGPTPTLSTSSYMVEGSKRSWKSTEDFVQEVSVARIYDGVHYRNSTEAGMAMGRKIGALAAKKHFGTP